MSTWESDNYHKLGHKESGEFPCPKCKTMCKATCTCKSTFEQVEPSSYKFEPLIDVDKIKQTVARFTVLRNSTLHGDDYWRELYAIIDDLERLCENS